MCEISCKNSVRLLRKWQKNFTGYFFAAHCIVWKSQWGTIILPCNNFSLRQLTTFCYVMFRLRFWANFRQCLAAGCYSLPVGKMVVNEWDILNILDVLGVFVSCRLFTYYALVRAVTVTNVTNRLNIKATTTAEFMCVWSSRWPVDEHWQRRWLRLN